MFTILFKVLLTWLKFHTKSDEYRNFGTLGVVKIQADCPTWLKLTALEYHFATQCIPTPVSGSFVYQC